MSIVTEYMDISVLSGRPTECEHHLIMGNSLRKLSDEDGLVIPLTHEEHNMSAESIHMSRWGCHLSRIIGQLAWEKEFYRRLRHDAGIDPARDAFRKRYGISYL